jgi:hypothetical protein
MSKKKKMKISDIRDDGFIGKPMSEEELKQSILEEGEEYEPEQDEECKRD